MPYLELFFYLLAAVLLLSSAWAWKSLAPWLPSRRADFPRINQALSLEPGQKMLEIGCGDARVCRFVALQNPECEVVGIELSLPFFLWSWAKSKLIGPKNLTIVYGDALKYDWTSFDALYTFALVKTINEPIQTKLKAEMKDSAKLVSYVFKIQDWDGTVSVDKPDKQNGVYVYKK